MFAFLSVLVVVLGALYGMHVYLRYLKSSFHNTELDKLLQRMDAWDIESKEIVRFASELNEKLGQVKNMVSLSKRPGA